MSLRPPIGFTIKIFQGSNQISLSITKKKSSLSSKTPSKCIFSMIFTLSTSNISASSYMHYIISMLHYQVVYHSSCISHDLCTLHHHHMNTLHSQHASLNHPASTKLNMLIELDIVMFTHQIIIMSPMLSSIVLCI